MYDLHLLFILANYCIHDRLYIKLHIQSLLLLIYRHLAFLQVPGGRRDVRGGRQGRGRPGPAAGGGGAGPTEQPGMKIKINELNSFYNDTFYWY